MYDFNELPVQKLQNNNNAAGSRMYVHVVTTKVDLTPQVKN